jgi:hypothetical protein
MCVVVTTSSGTTFMQISSNSFQLFSSWNARTVAVSLYAFSLCTSCKGRITTNTLKSRGAGCRSPGLLWNPCLQEAVSEPCLGARKSSQPTVVRLCPHMYVQFPQHFLPMRFPDRNSVRISCLPHTAHPPLPPHSLEFDHSNVITNNTMIYMKLFVYSCLLPPVTFSPLSSSILF